GILEIQRDSCECTGCQMYELEEFRSSLLFGRIYVLIPVDDVDVDCKIRGAWRERLITFCNFRIALRTKIPDRRGIFNQKSEIVGVEQRQHASCIGADCVFHSTVETVVDMCKHEIQIGTCAANGFQLGDPFLLHPERERCAE